MSHRIMLALPLALSLACAGSRDLSGVDPSVTDSADAGHDGLPCDVADVLQRRCDSCHSNPPRANAPIALASYEDLVKPSAADPNQTYAQRSVARIQDPTVPMPPGGGVPADELAILSAWVAAGSPKGTCGSVDGGTVDPLPDLGSVCSSGQRWNGRRNTTMRPGEACIACHAGDEGPVYPAMGTVYPSVHEQNDCNGTSSIVVELIGADGTSYSTTTNSAGNFMFSNAWGLAKPYRARVKSNGKEREMLTPQTSGDCNSCHTQSGDQNAPGRIVAP
jgi:hypothetical protein